MHSFEFSFHPLGERKVLKKYVKLSAFMTRYMVEIIVRKVVKGVLIMINKIDFKAKNLTSNAGLFLLLENAKSNGIFDFIENDLVFDNDSTNKIKMNHIKTIL